MVNCFGPSKAKCQERPNGFLCLLIPTDYTHGSGTYAASPLNHRNQPRVTRSARKPRLVPRRLFYCFVYLACLAHPNRAKIQRPGFILSTVLAWADVFLMRLVGVVRMSTILSVDISKNG